jgi:hypothetical protein
MSSLQVRHVTARQNAILISAGITYGFLKSGKRIALAAKTDLLNETRWEYWEPAGFMIPTG